MEKIILASSNAGKLGEIQALLAEKNIQCVLQSEFSVPDAIENGLSFVENAIIKARHAAALSGLPALADDSGLEVDALNGQPGIYSARYASGDNENEEADRETRDAANNRKLLQALEKVPQEKRTARFQCVIALVRYENDPMPLICQGTWDGLILPNSKGLNGFGYDPLFYVPTHHCASAELDPAVKNQLSHRGQALRELIRRWQA